MEKILTIQYSDKTYTPNEVSKQTTIVENSVAYNPNLIERIIASWDGYLLSNVNDILITQNGNYLVYGK
jgi:hypothetical protein